MEIHSQSTIEWIEVSKAISVKNFILDFYCDEKKLAIELDGGQYMERKSYDDKRTLELKDIGIDVIRFWDNEVLTNIDGVLELILEKLDLTPSLS